MQADMDFGSLRQVHRVIPSGHGDGMLIEFRLFSGIGSDEFAFDSHLLPILGIANTNILKFLDEVFLADLLFLMVMAQYLKEELAVFLFIA